MTYEKLAAYLDSFTSDSAAYPAVCRIKAKLAADQSDKGTVNNGDAEGLEDGEITAATPEQQTEDNTEGKVFDGAFQELEVENKIKEIKDSPDPVKARQALEASSGNSTDIPGTSVNATQKRATWFDFLKSKVSK